MTIKLSRVTFGARKRNSSIFAVLLSFTPFLCGLEAFFIASHIEHPKLQLWVFLRNIRDCKEQKACSSSSKIVYLGNQKAWLVVPLSTFAIACQFSCGLPFFSSQNVYIPSLRLNGGTCKHFALSPILKEVALAQPSLEKMHNLLPIETFCIQLASCKNFSEKCFHNLHCQDLFLLVGVMRQFAQQCRSMPLCALLELETWLSEDKLLQHCNFNC